jgi:hypothetical protein
VRCNESSCLRNLLELVFIETLSSFKNAVLCKEALGIRRFAARRIYGTTMLCGILHFAIMTPNTDQILCFYPLLLCTSINVVFKVHPPNLCKNHLTIPILLPSLLPFKHQITSHCILHTLYHLISTV